MLAGVVAVVVVVVAVVFVIVIVLFVLITVHFCDELDMAYKQIVIS
jgi:hypothetical protein